MAKETRKVGRKRSVKIGKKTLTGLEISVFDKVGEEKEVIKLPKEIFQVETKPQTIAQYIRVYLSNQRQGTVSTKTREEVSGSTRKIYRQKGTGRARHGDIKAPIFVGGGVAHGPKPRNFSLKVNKKQKRQVFFASLTLKNKERRILVADDGLLKIKPKTKEGKRWLDKLLGEEKIKNPKIAIILPKMEKNNLVLALRNLPQVNFLSIENLNAFEVFKNHYLIFLRLALDKLIKVFLKKTNES